MIFGDIEIENKNVVICRVVAPTNGIVNNESINVKTRLINKRLACRRGSV